MYLIKRQETHADGLVFVYFGVIDDLGAYDYAVWLTRAQSIEVTEHPERINTIIETYYLPLARERRVQELTKTYSDDVATKLEIRRAMRTLGVENILDTILETSEVFKKEWSDAIEIDFNDPLIQQAVALVPGLDIQQIKDEIMRNRAN